MGKVWKTWFRDAFSTLFRDAIKTEHRASHRKPLADCSQWVEKYCKELEYHEVYLGPTLKEWRKKENFI